MFKIIPKDQDFKSKLLYKKETKEFVTTSTKEADISYSFIYLYLGFDSASRLSTQFWGYHNDFTWIKKNLVAPKAVEGWIALTDDTIEGGDSIRMEYAYEWNTYIDENTGWIMLGSEDSSQELNYVEFLKNTIAGIDEQGFIQEFWLNPEFQ